MSNIPAVNREYCLLISRYSTRHLEDLVARDQRPGLTYNHPDTIAEARRELTRRLLSNTSRFRLLTGDELIEQDNRSRQLLKL